MVKIEALIPSAAVGEVCEALQDLRCGGVTVTGSRDSLDPEGERNLYRGREYPWMRASTRVEVVIPSRRLEEVLEMLNRTVQECSGEEARITTTPLTDVVRIRTGERGEDALSGT